MKVCAKCHKEAENNAKFCPQCGSSEFVGSEQIADYPMKWFKFLVNFELFCSVLYDIREGFQYITGSIYSGTLDIGISAEMVYDTFDGLRVVDVVYGLLDFALAGYAIFTRNRLVKYKSNAPMCLYLLYGMNAGVLLFYSIMFFLVVNESGPLSAAIGGVISSIVCIVLNRIYFNKRKEMFVN